MSLDWDCLVQIMVIGVTGIVIIVALTTGSEGEKPLVAIECPDGYRMSRDEDDAIVGTLGVRLKLQDETHTILCVPKR